MGDAAAVVERLRQALADRDRGVRYAAVQALGKAKAAPDVLAAMLGDDAWCVRQEAAWWLRRSGADALGALDRVLANGTPAARASATWALSTFGAEGIARLARSLGDADEDVRLEALAAAARMGREAAAPLIARVRALVGEGRSTEEVKEAKAALEVVDPAPPAAPTSAPAAEPKASPFPPTERPSTGSDPTPPPSTKTGPTEPQPAPGDPPPPPPVPDPALAAEQGPAPMLDRIEAVLGLSKGPLDAEAWTRALADPERDVRIAAVLALDHAAGDTTSRLRAALRDANARVVRAAIDALGRRRAGAADLAPFLADPALATSSAARDALEAIGPDAVRPVAEQMARGGYGVMHHGLRFFESVGAAGAPATETLSGLLASDDVNAREIAARCLIAIGPGARAAVPALVGALHDARLCVVANAALALGRVGLAPETLAAMNDPSARVRAYATFAVGWAMGERAGVDQAVFEPRLPVLDVGAPGPFPTAKDLDDVIVHAEQGWPGRDELEARIPRADVERVLRPALSSGDPAIAVRAAALLTENDVNVVEAERVMELTLPEGLRVGSPVDFDRMRSNLGSSELIACIEYAARAGRSAPGLRAVYADLHRIARPDVIPGLLTFDRTEERAVRDGSAELWQPTDRTLRFTRELTAGWLERDPGPTSADAARAWLAQFAKEPEGGLDAPALWLLRDFVPTAADAPLLLACAQAALDVTQSDSVREDATAWATVRLLGFLDDAPSLELLRTIAKQDDETGDVARAALARRGDAAALRALVARSRDEAKAFAVLMEIAPLVANRALVARVLATRAAGAAIADASELVERACEMGVRVPPEAFLGVEATLAARATDAGVLALAAQRLPGCATRRVADRLIDLPSKFATTGPAPRTIGFRGDVLADAEEFREMAGWLRVASPEPALGLLRALATSPDEALANAANAFLLEVRDEASTGAIVAWLRTKGARVANLEHVADFHRPEIRALLLEWSNDPKVVEDDMLELIARFDGWPADRPIDLRKGDASVKRAAIRAGDLARLRALEAADPKEALEPVPVRETVAKAALAGDAHARAELWSAMRAGRYRWTHNDVDPLALTLGRDSAVLPHWVEDLDSNCCRISDGMGDGVFEKAFGMPCIYDPNRVGVGRPTSEFVRTWMGLFAARFVWSEFLDRHVPEPE